MDDSEEGNIDSAGREMGVSNGWNITVRGGMNSDDDSDDSYGDGEGRDSDKGAERVLMIAVMKREGDSEEAEERC